MYKSINIFTKESDFESVREVLPDISLNYIEETGVIKCVERPNYFYIESLEDNNVVSFGVDDTWLGEKKSNVFYSFNKINWFSLSLVSSLTLSKNQHVYFKSDGSNLQKGEYTGNPNSNTIKSLFKTTKKFNVGGNVKILLNQNNNISNGGYQYLFLSLQVVDASNLELPATTLSDYCYSYMFCDCTSLTQAPELPATELSSHCYQLMFYNCTSLITAPELPATTLSDYCYDSMFHGCTSLITAPELPATTLSDYCYNSMFYNCTKLNHIKCLATDMSANYCTTYWVDGVASTGTFIKHPDMNDWITGDSGIPENWNVVDY